MVLGLQIQDGVVVGDVVVEIDVGLDPGTFHRIVERRGQFATCEGIADDHAFAAQDPVQQLLALFAGLPVDESAGAGFHHAEPIEEDVVEPGENLGAENIQAGGGEASGDLAEGSGRSQVQILRVVQPRSGSFSQVMRGRSGSCVVKIWRWRNRCTSRRSEVMSSTPRLLK